MCLTVRRSLSRGREQYPTHRQQFLESVGAQALRHCRSSPVRAVRWCAKCVEIVSRRVEQVIDSPMVGKANNLPQGRLFVTVRTSEVHCIRHLSERCSYTHITGSINTQI